MTSRLQEGQVVPILKSKTGTKPVSNRDCYLCKTVEHKLIDCKRFEKLPVVQRYTAVSRSGQELCAVSNFLVNKPYYQKAVQ